MTKIIKQPPFRSLFFLSAVLMLPTISHADSKESAASASENNIVRIEKNNHVSLCAFESAGQVSCRTAPLPALVGNATGVQALPSGPLGKSSFLVFSAERSTLCAEHTNAAILLCHKIPDASGVSVEQPASTSTVSPPRQAAQVQESSDTHTADSAGYDFGQALTAASSQLRLAMSSMDICVPDGGDANGDQVSCSDISVEVPGTRLPPSLPPYTGPSPGTVDIPTSAGPKPTPDKLRCEASCNTIYDKVDRPACKKVSSIRAKAICWAAAATKLGICISQC
jgi:hypothetical protein